MTEEIGGDWTPRQWVGCSLLGLVCGVGVVTWGLRYEELPLYGFVVGAVAASVTLSVWMAIATVVGGTAEDTP